MKTTIKKYITIAISRIRTIDWKDLRTRRSTAGVSIGIVALVFIIGSSHQDSNTVPTPLRVVTLLDTTLYAKQGALADTETKAHEMVVRAETGGKVTRTLAPGTQVAYGEVVAELENSAQRAALLQAEGALEAAQAGSDKTKSGLRSEQLSIRGASLDSAERGAVTTLLSAYATVDSSIKDTADKMFSFSGIGNPPTLLLTTKNSELEYKLIGARFNLDAVLSREGVQSNTITVKSNLVAELATTENEVRAARNFADMAVTALNDAIPTNIVSESQIAEHKAAMTTVRASLTSTLAAISAARTTLETAEKSFEEGESYSQDVDLASASASVKQAQGVYASALSAYQKTIVRASVPGRIASCSVEPGDVINVGADICRIVTTSTGTGTTYTLPLSSVKYTPMGAFVLTLDTDNTVTLLPVEAGLVTANSITVQGPLSDKRIVQDIRGLREGERVEVTTY